MITQFIPEITLKNLELKIPPAVVFFICIGFIWTIDYLLPPLFDISLNGWIIRAILAFGVFIGVSGVVQFAVQSTSVNPHKPDRATSLITSGVYRLSRNPMYLGMLIILLAAVLKFGQPIGFIVLPMYVFYMNRFQIKPEEEVMEEKFGEEYLVYKKNVRRWL